MEIHIMKPDNPVIIVDESEFDRIRSIAELKEEEVEELANELFLRHVKNSGINMRLRINNVDNLIRNGVVTELNYDERGWPQSVSDEVKYAIVDDISHYINRHFEHYKDDCKEAVDNEWHLLRNRYDGKLRFWKKLSIISFFLLIVECICRIIQ